MPENPEMYLNHITLTVLDDFYSAIVEAARTRSTSIEGLIIEYVRTGLGLGPSPRLSIEIMREKLVAEMKLFATDGLNTIGVFTQSEDRKVFAVVCVATIKEHHVVDTYLIAQIVGDCIVIERDQNNKPLVDALLQASVPR